LFSFLGEDGADEGHEGGFVASIGGEGDLGFGECAEDYVGEGLGEGDGLGEVGDGKLVFARRDGGLAAGHEDAVYARCVKFFLLGRGLARMEGMRKREGCATYIYHCGKRFEHVCVVQRCESCGIVAGHVVCDIGDQLSEVCDFEDLVQCEELERRYTRALQACWERRIWE